VVKHKYTNTGTYNVTLEVNDGDDVGFAYIDILVEPITKTSEEPVVESEGVILIAAGILNIVLIIILVLFLLFYLKKQPSIEDRKTINVEEPIEPKINPIPEQSPQNNNQEVQNKE